MPDNDKKTRIPRYVRSSKKSLPKESFTKTFSAPDNEIVDWFENYIKSPKYKQRLSNFYSNPEEVSQQRIKALQDTRIEDLEQDDKVYGPAYNKLIYSTRNGDREGVYENNIYLNNNSMYNNRMSREETLMHELSHSTNANSYNPNLRLSSQEENYIFDREKSIGKGKSANNFKKFAKDNKLGLSRALLDSYEMHDYAPTELKSDIDSLRYLLNKSNIYDAGTQDINLDILKKAREDNRVNGSFNFNRLQQHFTDEDLVDIMNKIASNNIPKNNNMAKYGKSVKKMPDGGKLKKKVNLPAQDSNNTIESVNWKDIPFVDTVNDIYELFSSKNPADVKAAAFSVLAPGLSASRMKNLVNTPTFKPAFDVLNLTNNQRQKLFQKYGMGYLQKWQSEGQPDVFANGGDLPKGVKAPKSSNIAAFNPYTLLNQSQPTPASLSPSEQFQGIEDEAYNKFYSKSPKIYSKEGERTAPLTKGKLRGATPNTEILNDLVAAADRAGVPRDQMLALAANESMFGKGYQTGRYARVQETPGIVQQNVISSWDLANQYKPVPSARFAHEKNIPFTRLTKSPRGYTFDVTDPQRYKQSLDSALTKHPEWIDQYRKANEGVIPQGDINYFDLTAQALRDKGVNSSAFNPGDPNYASKIEEARKLVSSDPILQPYLNKGKMKNGGFVFPNGQSVIQAQGKGSVNWLDAVTELERCNPNHLEAKSGIHIKKENRGKFTAAAKRAGMGVQEYARHVLSNPNASPTLKKRANFARNAAKWNHGQFGYDINNPFRPVSTPDDPIYYEEPQQYSPYSRAMLEDANQRISNYFQSPDSRMIPNNASLQGPQPGEQQFYIDPQTNPMAQEPTTQARGRKGPGFQMEVNPGALWIGAAGLANRTLESQRGINEYARLARRNAMSRSYNPYGYGTGSQALFEDGGVIDMGEHDLNEDQIDFLAAQGYVIELAEGMKKSKPKAKKGKKIKWSY